VVEVGHQHGGGIEVLVLVHGIVIGFKTFKRRRVLDGCRFRRPGVSCLVGRPPLLFAGQGRAAVFRVDGTVVAEEEVAYSLPLVYYRERGHEVRTTYERALAFETLERPLFGV
jgi:hypothetical protein